MIDFGTGVYLRSPKLADLNRMFAERNDPRNWESLDFQLDGTLRDFYFRNGKYINAHRYSLIRSWEDEC